MDTQLETLALLTAAVNAPLRKELLGLALDSDTRDVAVALKDGKSVKARESVQQWLRSKGVAWDGQSSIGESVIAALRRHTLEGAFRNAAKKLNILSASAAWLTDDQLKNGTELIEGILNECCGYHRESDSRPGVEVHAGK